MAERTVTYKKLASKGIPVRVRVLSEPQWQKLIESNPNVPRNFRHLRQLGHSVFNVRPKPSAKVPTAAATETIHRYPADEFCGTEQMELFLQGLANPDITAVQHRQLDEELAAAVPPLPKSMSTTHFELHWTETDPDPKNNISQAVVEETSRYLEAAWDSYTTGFGRAPYVTPGQAKIQVQFYWLGDGLSGKTSPNSPISLNSDTFTRQPGIRKPVSAHELFHREQYSFGLSTKYVPPEPKSWFVEGTANWGSVFVWQIVSGNRAIEPLFTDPNQPLFDSSYKATPFWIFIEGMQPPQPGVYSNAIVELFRQFDEQGSIMDALETVLELGWGGSMPYSTFDFNFMLFSWARINNLWREKRNGYFSIGPLYPVIRNSDGAAITPTLTISTHDLSRDQSYSTNTSVGQYGSQYYQVNLGSNTNGVGLYELTNTDAVKYLYTVTWMLNGTVVQSDVVNILRLVQGDLYVMYGIGLATVNQFVFSVSSNQSGPNNYQIYLSPTNNPKPPWL